MGADAVSDDLDIRGGGAVAVDTGSLRDAAAGFARLAADLDEIEAAVAVVGRLLWDVSPATWRPGEAIEAARRLIVAAASGAHEIVDGLRFAADVYELIELRAERAAADAAGDDRALARLDERIAGLVRTAPDADRQARLEQLAHDLMWPAELARQAPGALWWLAPGFGSSASALTWVMLQGVGRGRIGATERLGGEPPPVTVTRLAPAAAPPSASPAGAPAATPPPAAAATSAAAPTSLAAAAARMPAGESRVRVERYTMADGSRQFAVYVTGTRTVAPLGTEPFDMTSNVQLYTGERSASYQAALMALADAGAREGDVVHAFGHSQGAMVTARLALEGGFDTRTLVSFGSPVEADVGADTLSVTLRHRDDPVAALAGGGTAAVGAPGSFVAERTADPAGGTHDLGIPGHGIDTYTHTAQLLDASADPRMDAVRGVFAELGQAASVEVTEYAAVRPGDAGPVSPGASGAG